LIGGVNDPSHLATSGPQASNKVIKSNFVPNPAKGHY